MYSLLKSVLIWETWLATSPLGDELEIESSAFLAWSRWYWGLFWLLELYWLELDCPDVDCPDVDCPELEG